MFNSLLKSLSYRGEAPNLVLRKTKSFNKSRYSRNRQYYRTGVYWCLWLNIILVLGLYYSFYRYSLKFSYVFIFYVVGTLCGLLAFFNKNYFLGLWEALKAWANPIAYDFVLNCRDCRLTFTRAYRITRSVLTRFLKRGIKKIFDKFK